MKTHEESGFLERIQAAVKPLTAKDRFHLKTVQYGTYYGETRILLSSQDMDIVFKNTLKSHPKTRVLFIIHSIDEMFIAEYLSPVLKIQHFLTKNNPGLNSEGLSNQEKESDHEIQHLLEKTGFIDEISGLSEDIKKNLPALSEIFSHDQIEETMKRYSAEARKQNFSGRLFKHRSREIV